MPLLSVIAENRTHNSEVAITTNKTVLMRWPLTIGSGNVDSLVLSDIGWYMNQSSTSNFTNTITVVSAAIENGSVSVPLYKGGVRTWDITPGMNDSQYDPIYASQFSLSSFTRNSVIWLKMELSWAATGGMLPYGQRLVAQRANSQVLKLDKANTTIVNGVDTIGVFTTSGTAPGTVIAGYCPIVLGNYVSGVTPKVIYGTGDSILEGAGDQSYCPVGVGMFQRMLYGDGSAILSGINWSKSGSIYANFITSTNDRIAYWSKYCNIAIDEMGTNDFSSSGVAATTAQVVSRTQSTITKLRGYGIQKVVRTLLGPFTTGSWANDGTQTISGSWGPGGNIDNYNIAVTALVGTDVDAIVPMTAWRSLTDNFKWVANGTVDGVHPVTTIHNSLGLEMRVVVDAITLVTLGNGTNAVKRLNIGVSVGI